MEDYTKQNNQDEVFGRRIKAGKRTYFIDVKTTKGNDYFIIITESMKRNDGRDGYEKHKIFLYKEDFNKFLLGLNEAVNHIKEELMPDYDFDKFNKSEVEAQDEFEE